MIRHIIDSEIDLLVLAYRSEKKEINKYNLAIEVFKNDERAVNFFKKILEDEILHLKWIREKIEILKPDFFTTYDQREILTLQINNPNLNEIKVIDMLTYSLYEEKMGTLLHCLIKEEVQNKELKELFQTLESAEIAHMNSIRYEIDFLKKLKS